MNKNQIKGRRRATRWHNTSKSIGMPTEVNLVVVQQSNVPLPGEISASKDGEESAEVIVIMETSRGFKETRLNYETGSLT